MSSIERILRGLPREIVGKLRLSALVALSIFAFGSARADGEPLHVLLANASGTQTEAADKATAAAKAQFCQPDIVVSPAAGIVIDKEKEVRAVDTVKEGAGAFLGGGLMTPLAGPVAAGQAMAGLFYMIFGPPATHALQSQFATIENVWRTIDFCGRAKTTLARLLAQPGPGVACPKRVDIKLQMIGLKAQGVKPGLFQSDAEVCLVVQADLHIEERDVAPREESIVIDTGQRRADVPPPICAEFSAFARDDGALLRASLLETADVLAGIAHQRVMQRP